MRSVPEKYLERIDRVRGRHPNPQIRYEIARPFSTVRVARSCFTYAAINKSPEYRMMRRRSEKNTRGARIMKVRLVARQVIFSLIASVFVVLLPDSVFAHCDGLDGPVVKAAQKALETGNINPVLIWVSKDGEEEIRSAFTKTLVVRKLNPQAKELADMYFFETLVRIHRAGEGEPYTGLKPAGRDLGPVIPAADQAIESGKSESLLKVLTETINTEVREKFKAVRAKKNFKPEDIDAGREYVEAYVPFVSYIERIYTTAKSAAEGH